jgi:hypothetical protein
VVGEKCERSEREKEEWRVRRRRKAVLLRST